MVPSAIAPSFSHRSKSVSKEEEALSFFSETEGSTMTGIQNFCPKILSKNYEAFLNSKLVK